MGSATNKKDDTDDSNNGNSQVLHVLIVVLGDLGRSPRMQYHALSLLEAGHTVTLIGYDGCELITDLKAFCSVGCGSKRLHVIRFHTPTAKFLQALAPVYLLWRLLSLSLCLMFILFLAVPTKPKRVDRVILQNPPAMPLLLCAYIYCRVTGFFYRHRPCLIIDWHNLGYSMLASRSLQRLARKYEEIMAPLADGHLTVTAAMKDFLVKEMNVPVTSATTRVLHDCPPQMFHPLSLKEQHAILMKLDAHLCMACPMPWYASKDNDKQSLLTECYGEDKYRVRRGLPALVTSSTSWTPDEDFGILLSALVLLDARIQREASTLQVLVVVTGKGPQKAFYEQKITQLALIHVAVQTLWLEPADYPKLLACADLGVSLHTSTSGLDLPMKVLDLFGCEVPVCACNFACLSELVEDCVNGRIFTKSNDLAEQLWDLLNPVATIKGATPGCHAYGSLEKYSKQLQGRRRWNENWTENALPVILNTPY